MLWFLHVCVPVPLWLFFCTLYSLGIPILHSEKDPSQTFFDLVNTSVQGLGFTIVWKLWLVYPFWDFFPYSSFSLSMASLSIVPSASEMVEFRANGLGIPIIFPIDANGFPSVLPFTLISSSRCKILQYGSNARFTIVLLPCCHWPCVKILGLPTTDLQCGNSVLVNIGCTDSLVLARMYPR